MPFLKDVVGPCFIIEDVVARGGSKHHETIYFVPTDAHYQEDVKCYCPKTNAMTPYFVDKLRVVAVGKKLPYGRLILDKPYWTTLVIFHKKDNGTGMESTYSTVNFDIDTNPQLTNDDRYLEKLANERRFREDFDRYLRMAEQFFDERPRLPMADFA